MPGPFAAARPLARRLTRPLRRWRATHRAGPTLDETIDVGALGRDEPFTFRCNLCGAPACTTIASLDRESPTCAVCDSNMRFRAVARLVVRELFGRDIALPDLPVSKHLRGVGLSDAVGYAKPLAAKLDYVNTFLHKAPRLDITDVDATRFGELDFIIASDVFEHVAPPIAQAFANALRLLKPGGRLVLTVPFIPKGDTIEHFPDLLDWRVDRHDGGWRLVNRAADGTVTVRDDLVFHGGPGSTLEMRVFSQPALLRELRDAGFRDARVAADTCLPFGIHWAQPWSVPVVAYR